MRGLILAGGKSQRFGTDKALAVHEGKTLLEKAVNLLLSVRLEPVIVTRRGADYSFAGCTVLMDVLADKGPLGGIYTAMSFFKENPFLILTCDMPALTPAALSALLSAREKQNAATVFQSADGQVQPFPGIYEPSLFQTVRERLFQDQLSIQGLLDDVPTRKVVLWEGPAEVLANVNRGEDLVGLCHSPESRNQA